MEGQRRPTALGLTRQVSLVHSSNLRNILAAREEERKENKEEKGPKVTLAAILANEKRISSSSTTSGATTVTVTSRTLLDIIREEDPNAPVNWKNFKDRLRKRSSESIVLPEGIICDVNSFCTRVQSQPTTTNEMGDPGTNVGPTIEPQQSTPEGEQAVAPPVRMSLMALLEQTSETDGAPEATTDPPDEEEEGEEEEMMHTCCVCMVRHKGAAFIPCGHTFCRLCSRELWVSRGNCPLCNGFILEILDIF